MPTHKKPESERFKGPAKYVQYLFARVLITLLQHLPIRIAYRFGRAVGLLAWKLMPRRRATVRENLEVVNAWMRAQDADGEGMERAKGEIAVETRRTQVSGLNSQPLDDLDSQVREVFQRFGANLFSGFTFSRMSPERVAQHIQVEGLEQLNAALEKGRGVIVLLGHMGPWEALTQLPGLARKHGIEAPFGAMYRPLNNRYLDDWFRTHREGQGTRLFSRRDGFHKPVDFIRSGGMLGILADQKVGRSAGAEIVPFFGRNAKTNPMAGLFCRRSGAPALTLAVITESPCRWRLEILNSFDSSSPIEDRTDGALRTNRALEATMALSPLDGFWLHQRFSKSIT